jgi:hypothetical protein
MKTPSDGVQYIAKNTQSARLHEQKRYLKSIPIDNNTKKINSTTDPGAERILPTIRLKIRHQESCYP